MAKMAKMAKLTIASEDDLGTPGQTRRFAIS